MNLEQLAARLVAASGSGIAGLSQQIAHGSASGIEAGLRARKHAKSVVMSIPDDSSVQLSGTQPYGVYQEGFGPPLATPGLDDVAQRMAEELAAAAVGLITGRPA